MVAGTMSLSGSMKTGRGEMEWQANLSLPPREEWRGKGKRNPQETCKVLSLFCLHCYTSKTKVNIPRQNWSSSLLLSCGTTVLISLSNCPSTKCFSGDSCLWIFLNNKKTFKNEREHHKMTGFYQGFLACSLQQTGSLPNLQGELHSLDIF